jgi:S-adenosyl methyltransferase
LASTKELLTSDPRGATAYIDADLARPQTILRDPALRDTLDLSRSIALMLVSVLHFVTDDDVALRAVHTLVDAMPSGS